MPQGDEDDEDGDGEEYAEAGGDGGGDDDDDGDDDDAGEVRAFLYFVAASAVIELCISRRGTQHRRSTVMSLGDSKLPSVCALCLKT